jgi:hypothetical protein
MYLLPSGFVTGTINGIIGSQVMPILPYLLALDLNRDVFVTKPENIVGALHAMPLQATSYR